MNPINYEEATRKQRREIREKYILFQEGKCWYCKSDIYGVPSKKVRNKSIQVKD